MDPLAVGVIVFVVLLVALALLSARANRRRPLSDFGNRRAVDTEDGTPEPELEYQDLAEMLDATNARRRARGLPERSLSDAIREFGDE